MKRPSVHTGSSKITDHNRKRMKRSNGLPWTTKHRTKRYPRKLWFSTLINIMTTSKKTHDNRAMEHHPTTLERALHTATNTLKSSSHTKPHQTLTNIMTPQVLRTKQQSEPIGPHRQNNPVPITFPGLSIVNCRETEIITTYHP